jgi:trans-AT polyketide synthase/acyltransferase/oxidoreductase domain-containing protein
MAGAAAEFARHLDTVGLADPERPVLSNVTGEPYRPGTVRELLAEQIRRPVRWAPSMRYLLDRGVTEVVELGPGTVLRGLWRAVKRSYHPIPAASTPAPAGTPAPASRPPAVGAPRAAGAPPAAPPAIAAHTLGSAALRADYGIRYAYLAGAMYHGIASADLVLRLGEAGLMGFFGAGGLRPADLDEVIGRFQRRLGVEGRYGMNLLCTLDNPRLERDVVDLYLRRDVRYLEAAGYPQVTAPLVRWRYTGAYRDRGGRPATPRYVVAKVSRPEVATAFLSPPPEPILTGLVADGLLTTGEAEIARSLPLSDDLCAESDSGGHTDGAVALTLLPSMLRLRDETVRRHGYPKPVRVGAAGGLGTPEALAAAFVLGADFVMTGSVNQCTPQAGTSDLVKDLLATLDVQDVGYAPAGDMFELGAQVQVVRKGTLFPTRAGRLYQLYRRYGSLDEIDAATRRTIEKDWFGGRTFDDIWAETRAYLADRHPDELDRARRDPRRRMALVFRWYFRWSTDAALRGDPDAQVDYQIHCGPAMGAFNRWVAGTDLADWRQRDVAVIAERLMAGAAQLLSTRLAALAGWSGTPEPGDRPPPPASAQH